MITTINTWHSIVVIKLFLVMKFFKIYFQQLSNIQYSIMKNSHHAIFYIPLNYLFYNWKIFTFWPSSLPTSGNHHHSVLYELIFGLFLFCLAFKISCISKIIWYSSFSVWLTSLGIIASRSIHTVANGKMSFFFKAE